METEADGKLSGVWGSLLGFGTQRSAPAVARRLKLINAIAGTVLIAFGLILLLDGFMFR